MQITTLSTHEGIKARFHDCKTILKTHIVQKIDAVTVSNSVSTSNIDRTQTAWISERTSCTSRKSTQPRADPHPMPQMRCSPSQFLPDLNFKSFHFIKLFEHPVPLLTIHETSRFGKPVAVVISTFME